MSYPLFCFNWELFSSSYFKLFSFLQKLISMSVDGGQTAANTVTYSVYLWKMKISSLDRVSK